MAARKKTTTRRKAASKRKPAAKRKVTATKKVAAPKPKPKPKPRPRRKAVVEEVVASKPVTEEVVAPEQEQPEVQPQPEVAESAAPSVVEDARKEVAAPAEVETEDVETETKTEGTVEPAPEESEAETTPEEPPQQAEEKVSDGRSTKIYVVSIVISIIVLAVASGIFVYRSQQSVEESQPEPTSTPEVVMEDKKEEVKALERKDITLEILNGSGVAGLAGDTSEVFEGLGYEVKEIGNTAATEGNQLYISEKYTEEELDNLIKDAKQKLDIPEVAAKLSDLDVTARIVLGK